MKVLLVDASPVVRSRMRELLEDSLEVDILEADAVERATGAPDVVILDLPRDGGVGALSLARARFPTATLVVSTNDTSAHHKSACEARGADFFFDKSREFERTIDVIRARSR